ncbi:hypothetical protein JHK86_006692 [Glycine max]|nr:hypothetical protein JHK86_006692 [Glycine max]
MEYNAISCEEEEKHLRRRRRTLVQKKSSWEEHIAKALNSCSATTKRLKQELETTTQRQEIVTCFLRDYQLSPKEI